MKYHSTKGTRDHMKALSLWPSHSGIIPFHDLDETVTSKLALWKRPWWVRWVDNPTVEIDWKLMQRFDGRKMPHASYSKYAGEHVTKRLEKLRLDRTKKWILENKPGYKLCDRALDISSRAGSIETQYTDSSYSCASPKDAWRQSAITPSEMGVPRWKGNPEENSRLVRAALRHFGADQVGFVQLDENMRKLIYSFNTIDGKAQEFENIDQAYETDKKLGNL